MATAIDTETTLADVVEPVPRVVSVAVAGLGTGLGTGLGARLYHWTDPRTRDVLAAAFDGPTVFANAPFDVFAIWRRWPELLGNVIAAYQRGDVFDVLTRAKMSDIAIGRFVKRYNLGTVAKRWANLDVDKDDPWRLRYAELEHTPIERWPEEARQYAERDATATLAAFLGQEREAAAYSPNPLGTQAIHARAHLNLYAQTLVGCRTDPIAVDLLDRKIVRWITELTRVCRSHGYVRIEGKRKPRDVATPAKVQAAIVQRCAELGVAPLVTDKGAVSCDEAAMMHAKVPGLEGVLERGPATPPGLPLLLDAEGRFTGHPLDACRRRNTLINMRTGRIEALRRPVVRWRYNELVDSGRTSASKPNKKKASQTPWREWCGIQAQNQPREGGFRECLVPDPGCVFVASDIAGAELAALSDVQRLIFGYSVIGDALDRGEDIHARFGLGRILGVDPKSYDPKNPDHKNARQGAKPFNFGKWGGMGSAKFQVLAQKDYGVYFELHEIDRLSRLWEADWQARPYFEWVRAQMIGGIATIVHPVTGYTRARMRYTEACNFLFQHLAAMVAKAQLWDLFLAQLDPRSPLYRCPQKLFVHDEHVTQVEHGEPAHCPEHTGPTCKRCGYTAERLGPGWIFPRVEAARDTQEWIMNTAAKRVAPRATWRTDSHILWRYQKC